MNRTEFFIAYCKKKIVAQLYWYRRQTHFVQAQSVNWKVLPKHAKRSVYKGWFRFVQAIVWRCVSAETSNRTLLPAFIGERSHKSNTKYNRDFISISFDWVLLFLFGIRILIVCSKYRKVNCVKDNH